MSSAAHSPPPSPHFKTQDSGSLRSRKTARERRILQSGEDRINRILSSTPNLPAKVNEPNSPPIEAEELSSLPDGLAKRKSARGSRGRATGRRFVPLDQSSVMAENDLKQSHENSEYIKPISRPTTPIVDTSVQQINDTNPITPKQQLPTGLEGIEKLGLLFEKMNKQQQNGNSTTPLQMESLLNNIDQPEPMFPFNNLFNSNNTAGAQPFNTTSTASPTANYSQSSYFVQFVIGLLLVLYLLFTPPTILDSASGAESAATQLPGDQHTYLQLTKYLSFSQVQPFYLLLTFSVINQTVRMIKYKNERGSRFQQYPPPLNAVLANFGTVAQVASGMWDDLTLVIFLLGHLITLQTVVVGLLY